MISRFISDAFPGWVEFELSDAYGEIWKFQDKAPVVSTEHITRTSEFPIVGAIACTILDASAKNIVVIGTEEPLGIVSREGKSQFEVCPTKIKTHTEPVE